LLGGKSREREVSPINLPLREKFAHPPVVDAKKKKRGLMRGDCGKKKVGGKGMSFDETSRVLSIKYELWGDDILTQVTLTLVFTKREKEYREGRGGPGAVIFKNEIHKRKRSVRNVKWEAKAKSTGAGAGGVVRKHSTGGGEGQQT